MPTSPSVNLTHIEDKAKKIVEESGGKNCSFTQEPIAFGLKAIIAFFAWPEGTDTEELENSLSQIDDVNSVQLIDMRRAFG